MDRFVPDPWAVGLRWVLIALVQPYAEQVRHQVQEWLMEDALVNLWESDETLFGVFLTESKEENDRLVQLIRSQRGSRTEILLSSELQRHPIPVYFDFESAWCTVVGTVGPLAYPRALPSTRPDSQELGSPRLNLRQAMRVRQLLTPIGSNAQLSGARAGSSSISSRLTDRWLFANQYMELRTFLNPSFVGRSVSGFPERIAFVHGWVRPHSSPQALFSELVHRAGASPFLYHSDGAQVFSGFLSRDRSSGQSEGRKAPGSSLMAVTQANLQNVTVIRQSLADLRETIRHRFDRLELRSMMAKGDSPFFISR
jgi:hypothetical protein